MNFGANPDGARQEINTDVARQTDGIIGHLFPPGAIDPSTLLALVNTIYLHAAWQHPFDPERTSNRPFRLLDGGTVRVPMMERPGRAPGLRGRLAGGATALCRRQAGHGHPHAGHGIRRLPRRADRSQADLDAVWPQAHRRRLAAATVHDQLR